MALAPLLNSQGKQLYWLRETAGEKRVINPRAISNTTGEPNPGPGLEYLPIWKESVLPDYDPRFTRLETTEAPNAEGSQVAITYSAPDKSKEEVKAAIDNAKRFELQKHFGIPDQMEKLVIVLAAIAREAKGLELADDERAALNDLVGVAAIVKQDKAAAEELKAQVDLGNKPDIEAAWVAKV